MAGIFSEIFRGLFLVQQKWYNIVGGQNENIKKVLDCVGAENFGGAHRQPPSHHAKQNFAVYFRRVSLRQKNHWAQHQGVAKRGLPNCKNKQGILHEQQSFFHTGSGLCVASN